MERAAVFDVDGTLVDTNYLHTVTWWEAFRQAGHRVPMTAVHGAVGLGGADLVDHLLGPERDREQDGALSAAHKSLFGAYSERLQPLAGVPGVLRELAGRGWRVVLATSAGGAELEALLRAVGAGDVITGTAGAGAVKAGKPAPDPVLRALELAGASAQGSVFVGDTVWDMRAAARAGTTGVALLSGGVPGEELREAGAAAVYRDCAELLERMDGSPFG